MDDSSGYRRVRRRRGARELSTPDIDARAEREAWAKVEQPPPKKRQRQRNSKNRAAKPTTAETDRNGQTGSRRWLIVRLAVTLIGGAVGYYLFTVTFAENATPATIAIMALFVPAFFVIYFLMSLSFRPTAFFIGLYFQFFAFLFLIHLRQREFEDFSFDWAIYAHLSALLAGAGIVLWNSRQLLLAWQWRDFVVILMTAFFVLCALSLINSPNPGYGAASLAMLLTMVGIAAVTIARLRPGEVETVVALAFLPPVLLSLVSYLTQTEMDFTWGMSTDYSVPRLRGVSGTPVGMSHHCALFTVAIIARLATAKTQRAHWIAFALLAIPLAIYVSWLSESRSPPMAFLIALAVSVVLYYKPFGRLSLLISIIGCLAALPLAYFVIEQGVTQSVLAGLSRSGQAAEISTLTGRVEIWAKVFEFISQKPYLGHGLGSGVIILLEAFEGTDLVIVHSHNLAIHMAFSVGVGGAVVITLLIAAVFARAYRTDDFFVLLMIIYFFMSNITETAILGNRPSFITFIFLLTVCRVLSLRTKDKQAKDRQKASKRKPSKARRRSSVGTSNEPAPA